MARLYISDNKNSLTTINGTNRILLKGIVDKDALNASGYDPNSINTIEFGTGVTGIGDWTFSSCYSLTSVTMGENVTSIGDSVFNNCSGLTSLTFLGKTLEQVQGMANYSWDVDSSIIQVG